MPVLAPGRPTDRRVADGVLPLATVNLLALGALTAPAASVLALRLDAIASAPERADLLALVLLSGAIGATVGNPLFGFLSDLGSSAWRRRRWLIVGAVGGFLGSVALALAPDVATIAITWAVTQFFYNASFAASAALLADRVAEHQRSVASGIFGAAAFLGTIPPLVLSAVLAQQLAALTLTMPVIALVGITVIALRVRETPSVGATSSFAEEQSTMGAKSIWQFALLTIQRAVLQLAFGLLASFTLYFAAERFTMSATGAAPVASLSTGLGGAAIVVASLLTGRAVARRGRYGPVVIASSIGLAAAASLRAIASDPWMLWVTAALGGVSLGAFYAVDLAAAMRLVARRSAGRALGLFNLAETLPQIATPILAGSLLSAGSPDPIGGDAGFTLLFGVAAGLSLIAAALVPALSPTLRRSSPDGVTPGRGGDLR